MRPDREAARGAALVVRGRKGRDLTQKKRCGLGGARAPLLRERKDLGPVRTLAKQGDIGRGELAEERGAWDEGFRNKYDK